MNGRKNFHTNLKNQPNEPVGERVVSERGRKELPPSTRGGENLKPNRYYEHKQHAFDSYCKKVLKCEACNGYRQISRHQKRFASLEELSEAEMAQLAVYDRYPWEYTTFPVGGAVILIEDDRLAEALNALPQDGRNILVSRVVRHYSSYIAALSTRTSYGSDGYPRLQVDEELRNRLEAKLIIAILDFDLT